MPSLANADLSGLATLAQTQDGDLRPLLLRTQAALFASSTRRDPGAVATFEALALGLIPLVDDETVDDVAVRLGTVADVPAGVTAALRMRLVDRARRSAETFARETAELEHDLTLALDIGIVLDGHRLAQIVERARTRPRLAEALLARPDLTIFDRAALYRFASLGQRTAMRQQLAERLPPEVPGRLAQGTSILARILAEPDGRRTAQLLREVGLGPSPESLAVGLVENRLEQELYALGLLAIGLGADDCIARVLTLDARLGGSVEAVFHMVRIARSTPAHVAAFIVEPDLVLSGRAEAPRPVHVPHHDAVGAFDRSGRHSVGFAEPGGRGLRGSEADRARRGRDAGGPPDHRSRATTGRDRS